MACFPGLMSAFQFQYNSIEFIVAPSLFNYILPFTQCTFKRQEPSWSMGPL